MNNRRRFLKDLGSTAAGLFFVSCGMAGSFGFEKEHYDISIQIAERRLAPAVRGLPPDAVVVAGGVSCRQQIEHTTGRRPLHPAEIVASALGEM